MADILKGYTYTTGSPGNQVTADNLNQLVDAATVQTSLVTAKTEKTTPAPDDLLLISDSANGNAFKKLRVSNLPQGGATVQVGPTVNGLAQFRNLLIVNHAASPTTTLDITIDEIAICKSNGTPLFLRNVSISVNITVSGAGGLDTGTEAAGTWYYIYVMSDGTTTSALLSTSGTAPTLPGAYVYFGLIGAIRNDLAANLWTIFQRDKDVVNVPVGLYYSSSASTSPFQLPSGGPTEVTCPIAKKLRGSVYSYTSVDCAIQIAADSQGTGASLISTPTSGNALAVSFNAGDGAMVNSTNVNTNAFAAGPFEIAVDASQDLWIKTDAQTTHWVVLLSGYSL